MAQSTLEIYEMKIHDPFAGDGTETIIVQGRTIKAHLRGWANGAVVDDQWSAPLKNRPVSRRGRGWRKLTGDARAMAQDWAEDILIDVASGLL